MIWCIKISKEDKDIEGRPYYCCRLIPRETTNVMKWLSSHGYKILVSPSKTYPKEEDSYDPVGKSHVDFVRDLNDDKFKRPLVKDQWNSLIQFDYMSVIFAGICLLQPPVNRLVEFFL